MNIKSFDIKDSPVVGRFLIEASAGTGKTYSLEHLVVRLLVEQKIAIENLLIVTYTKAATAELSERVRALISTLCAAVSVGAECDDMLLGKWRAQGYSDEELAACFTAALERFDDASILTIHSFCQKMLSAYLFTRGGDYGIEVGDDSAIKRRVVQEFLQRHLAGMAPEMAAEFEKWEGLAKNIDDIEQLAQSSGVTPEVFRGKEAADVSPVAQALMTEFAKEVPERLRELKQKAQIMTYSDMLVQMHELVRSNTTLVQRIREQYKGVLIDEFQDTDALQYDIFRRLFLDATCDEVPCVFFVGDPKQAIYSFRMAEIETYLEAKRTIEKADRGQILQLEKNFRSTPALISFINAFFGGGENASSHFLTEGIGYADVGSNPEVLPLFKKEGDTLTPLPSVVLLKHPEVMSEEWKKRFHSADDRSKAEAQWMANDIADLLRGGDVWLRREGSARKLRGGDIAVLVAARKHGKNIQRELRRLGIRSVINADDDVMQTAEASEILAVLKAMENPQDSRAFRTACATRVIGRTLNELKSEEKLVSERALLGECMNRWDRFGAPACFSYLFGERNTAGRILKTSGGDRVIANYEQIAELLHAQQTQLHSISAVIRQMEIWRAQKGETPPENRVIRSVSDDNVVKIETIHKSKGLEYPVVYLAETCKSGQTSRKTTSLLREISQTSDGKTKRTLFVSPSETSYSDHEPTKQRYLQEQVRMAYVAMTRASSRLVLSLLRATNSNQATTNSKNSYTRALLGSDLDGQKVGEIDPAISKRLEDIAKELKNEYSTFAEGLTKNTDCAAFGATSLCSELDRADRYIEIRTTMDAEGEPLAASGLSENLAAAEAVSSKPDWSRSSFTAISRNFGGEEHISEDYEAEEMTNEAPVDQEKIVPVVVPVAVSEKPCEPTVSDPVYVRAGEFPKGAEAGDFLHKQLQTYMSVSDRDKLHLKLPELVSLLPAMKDADEAKIVRCADWVWEMMETAGNTPLFRDDRGEVLLANGLREERIAEMEFMLGVRSKSLTVKDLTEKLREVGYDFKVDDDKKVDLHGYLSGAIDLVFCLDGRFWIIDWKSNAENATDGINPYTQDAMKAQIEKHHYGLQYLIYLVVLKRHLMATMGLDDDAVWDHIGGALYVFMRGVDSTEALGEDGRRHGVFYDRPREAVDCLDRIFAGTEA